MSLFNQFIPNLTRSFTGTETNGTEAEATVKPSHQIVESADGWNLTVQLPGVSRENLEFSAEDNLITIRGLRTWQKPGSWTELHRESSDATFQLVLEHSNNVDVEKIKAELKDGVLQVTLPKTEAVKPRKIAIN